MAEDFLPNANHSADVPPSDPKPAKRSREAVRVLVVGSRQGITSIVHDLYQKDFAQIDEWSDLQPEPNTGQLMRVLTKYIGLA